MSIRQPDLAVIRRAQKGDERAFAVIVRNYEAPVFNYVLRMVGSRSLAEDLTQDVFLRVYQGLRGYSLRAKFTTWLFQVAKNRVVDEMRAVERRPRAAVTIDEMPQLEVLDAPIEQSEAIATLWRAVEELSLDLREAMLLRDIAGLSYNEISDALNVTLATVKWRIFKAREEVQQVLEEQGVELGVRRTSSSDEQASVRLQ
ncbi:MAG: sigma-70 family RNA polymerase sigma factor [Gaiellaceae bacterium]|jgi:RNA polymerase sigma-70 factor (ECF subfamily)